MNEQSEKKPGLWFIKKNDKVTGPFPVKLIGSYLILGRIDLETLVSPDQKKWIPIGKLPSLIPDELKNANTPEGKLALHQAKLREDERTGESRRDGENRRVTDRHETDRRNASDRRKNEEVISAAHVKLKADFSAQNASAKKRAMLGLALLVIVMIALVAGFFLTEPAQEITKTDCNVKAGPAIDWQSCNKNNADLVNANLSKSNLHSTRLNTAILVKANLQAATLSYAELENANLSEANLTGVAGRGISLVGANLTGAILVGADLSYANFTDAVLRNVQVLNTRFDNAIWSDGRRCAAGSVDQCIFETQ